MSDVTTENKPAVQTPDSSPQQSGSNTMQMILIGILVLAAAALIAYQFIGCAGCYGARYPL
jgi:hypothetical protein